MTPAAAASPADRRFEIDEVLADERARLRDPDDERPLAALCLSGGGIRSASFALGVIQGLARSGLLEAFDYLSTVSGGGYTGAWLSAWMFHTVGADPAAAVSRALHGGRDLTPDLASLEASPVEPEPVRSVRLNSRYLGPATGFFSLDTWTIVATIARNLFVNWLVVLPLLAAALLVPEIYAAFVRSLLPAGPATQAHLGDALTIAWAAAIALLTVASASTIRNLPSYGNAGNDRGTLLRWNVAPLLAGVAFLTIVIASPSASAFTAGSAVAFGALGFALTWVVMGAVSGRRRWRPGTWVAGAVSGATAVGTLWFVAQRLRPHAGGRLYATVAFPLVLGVMLLGAFVFVAVAGTDVDDDDLEWWARESGWLSMAVVVWPAVSGLVLFAPDLLGPLVRGLQHGLNVSPTGAGGLVGVMTSGLGVVTAMSGRTVYRTSTRQVPVGQRLVFALAAPAFCALLLAGLSWTNRWLLAGVEPAIATRLPIRWVPIAAIAVLGATYVIAGLAIGRVAPVNKFSLHGMYRARLIRTFLGASRPANERHPNPFTGFDADDDIVLAKLSSVPRPMLIVNMTLNTIADASRGPLHRKAEPFSATPYFVGTPSLGYRPADQYAAGPRRPGMSLGTAMTISGAAASPNMGSASSPPLTFLMTLFNARLGVWLGNPDEVGEDTWRTAEPRQGAAPVLRELIGLTSEKAPYVYLSDGGHFDNLGLWQVIRRRCRFVVVSDAGCDPGYTFQDLATSIRQVRIDLGVPIVFDEGCRMSVAGERQGNPHVAFGRIAYSAKDGTSPNDDGVIVYVKATTSGDEPLDVLNYGTMHPAFPHESTAEQWFGEAQFESYRVLGFHSVIRSLAAWQADVRVAAMLARVLPVARTADTPQTAAPGRAAVVPAST